jgi:lipopolysaccharide/colanic/teichoic acid biosynthesis glycosyltransferase
MYVTQNVGPLITSSKDDRITRSGKFLRKWKLDELPQFVNVLRNEMSLVGPRPEVEYYVNKWPIDIRDEILRIKPGLVDPFTLQMIQEEIQLGKVENPEEYYLSELLPQKLKHYMIYMENRTVLKDYWFLVKALFITFSPCRLRRNINIK